MDIEAAKFAFQVINALATLGIGVWLYLEKRSDRTNARIDETNGTIEKFKDEVDGRLDRHATQLAHLEAKADGAPTHDDLAALHEKINKVAEGVSNLGGQFKGVENLLDRIHEHLLRVSK